MAVDGFDHLQSLVKCSLYSGSGLVTRKVVWWEIVAELVAENLFTMADGI